MKQIIFFILLLNTSLNFAQNKIKFEYDVAGNQIQRTVVCINCNNPTGKSTNKSKEISELIAEDLIKSFPEDAISYYPNPVKEELYLKWDLIENTKVSEIQLYSLNGQLLKRISKLENQNTQNITFQQYPQGIYNILFLYTNGEQKSLKIIKQ